MSDDSDIRQSISSVPVRKTKSLTFSLHSLLSLAVIIVVALLGFWGGRAYQKHHTKAVAVSASALSNFGSGSGAQGGFGGRRAGGGIASVTAISSSSITVSTTSGSSKTYDITSSTVVTDSGQAVSYTDIATGDKVIVIPDSSNTSDASRILVNPNFGGGFGGAQPSGSSTVN